MRQHLDALLHPLQMDTVLEVEHLATVMGMVRRADRALSVAAQALYDLCLEHRPDAGSAAHARA